MKHHQCEQELSDDTIRLLRGVEPEDFVHVNAPEDLMYGPRPLVTVWFDENGAIVGSGDSPSKQCQKPTNAVFMIDEIGPEAIPQRVPVGIGVSPEKMRNALDAVQQQIELYRTLTRKARERYFGGKIDFKNLCGHSLHLLTPEITLDADEFGVLEALVGIDARSRFTLKPQQTVRLARKVVGNRMIEIGTEYVTGKVSKYTGWRADAIWPLGKACLDVHDNRTPGTIKSDSPMLTTLVNLTLSASERLALSQRRGSVAYATPLTLGINETPHAAIEGNDQAIAVRNVGNNRLRLELKRCDDVGWHGSRCYEGLPKYLRQE